MIVFAPVSRNSCSFSKLSGIIQQFGIIFVPVSDTENCVLKKTDKRNFKVNTRFPSAIVHTKPQCPARHSFGLIDTIKFQMSLLSILQANFTFNANSIIMKSIYKLLSSELAKQYSSFLNKISLSCSVSRFQILKLYFMWCLSTTVRGS